MNRYVELPEFTDLLSNLMNIANDGSVFIQCKYYYMSDWPTLIKFYRNHPGTEITISKDGYNLTGIIYKYTKTGLCLTNVQIEINQRRLKHDR